MNAEETPQIETSPARIRFAICRENIGKYCHQFETCTIHLSIISFGVSPVSVRVTEAR